MTGKELDPDILDDAARAGWLYYVGGRTQDEIAKTLGVSRQRAQRLVSKAVADGLLRIRLEHPIAGMMDMAARLRDKYNLNRVRVAPDLGVDGNLHSIAPFAARTLESVLASPDPLTVGFGTGRYLRAMIEQLSPLSCPHHRLVSIIGNTAPDGTANVYDVLMRLADFVKAPHYPLLAPVFAESAAECEVYMSLKAVRQAMSTMQDMDVAFVGIGQMTEDAPMLKDGFLTHHELQAFQRMGAIGEIVGRPYDRDGNYIDSPLSARLTSYRLYYSDTRIVFGISAGAEKIEPIRSAIKGQIINALVTDEPTARALLE